MPVPSTTVVGHEAVLAIGKQKAGDMKKLVARMAELLQSGRICKAILRFESRY